MHYAAAIRTRRLSKDLRLLPDLIAPTAGAVTLMELDSRADSLEIRWRLAAVDSLDNLPGCRRATPRKRIARRANTSTTSSTTRALRSACSAPTRGLRFSQSWTFACLAHSRSSVMAASQFRLARGDSAPCWRCWCFGPMSWWRATGWSRSSGASRLPRLRTRCSTTRCPHCGGSSVETGGSRRAGARTACT